MYHEFALRKGGSGHGVRRRLEAGGVEAGTTGQGSYLLWPSGER